MTEPFFSRWSQRKQALAKGLPVEEPAVSAASVPSPAAANVAAAAHPNADASSQALQRAPVQGDGPVGDRFQNPPPDAAAPAPKPELPTLDDVRALTPKSDFQPFMRQGVATDVRNAAVKKLFADPHFNIMDGLDIYIDDYNTPDPLPAGMLKKMVGAQFLNLFPDEAKAATTPELAGVSPVLSPTTAQSEDEALEPRANPEQSPASPESPKDVAQSPPSLPTPEVQPPSALHPPAISPHDHPDLQLQPNHAPASPSPGPSTG